MSASVSAREEILSRIRTALPGEPADIAGSYARVSHDFNRSGSLSHEACIELLIDRLIDYDTEMLYARCDEELPTLIATALSKADETKVVVPSEFPQAWLPAGLELQFDNDLPTEAIDAAEVVVTTCELAVASSGTIFLLHGGSQGRRILTLLPDHHICLVRRDQVVEVLPTALAMLPPGNTKPVTTIAGPSATSDIEMTRVRGVHGPRRLTVILIDAYNC